MDKNELKPIYIPLDSALLALFVLTPTASACT